MRSLGHATSWMPLLLAAFLAAPASADSRTSDSRASKSSAGNNDHTAFFKDHVRPLLTKHCLKCHGHGKTEGGLDLTSRASLLKGGDYGPAIDLENVEESPLLEAINYDGLEMPPTGKLPKSKIDVLTKWAKRGAPWGPNDEPIAAEHEEAGPPAVNDENRKFWSFQPVKRPDVPEVGNPAWIKNPIDAFVLANLESAGLEPNPRAEKLTLLRRATYDLTGLPPTPKEIDEFLADTEPGAYERLVDRLLQSPHYGERWGRHWLDLVRYAETNSFERDGAKPHVWRYRDYVINSFGDDKPYDQFIREQLAGDEIEGRTAEQLIATGYFRIGLWDDEPADRLMAEFDELDDYVRTTGEVFLGLRIGCARCHDHKLDPVPQADYYRMLAFFRGIRHYGVRSPESVAAASLRSIATPEQQASHEKVIADWRGKIDDAKAQMKAIEDSVKDDFIPVEHEEFRHEQSRVSILKKRVPKKLPQENFDRYVALGKRIKHLERHRPQPLHLALCVTEVGPKPATTHVLGRGNPHSPSEEVSPGFPSILGVPDPTIPIAGNDAPTSGRRTVLADWIASEENPLTARVMANRVWQHHFGRGIVASPNDFGMAGLKPTHPELLDWLASEFVQMGWRLKPLHRLIMTSNTYQMSSRANPKALAADPDNETFWRFNMRRLGAEELRDSILSVIGSLNPKMGGPSIYSFIQDEVLQGQSLPGEGWGKSPPAEQNRRSVYIHVKRSLITPILASFDVADVDSSCPVRFETTQPTQCLATLNSEFLHERAKRFAEYLTKQAGDDPKSQVELALLRTLQRPATEAEIARGVKLINELMADDGATPEQALAYFCLVTLNLNEFLYLD
ncbi:Planctomycete cytochrome C [Planctomycetes bacterium Pan216]|uniref:Planctomycete cytochrome C n=1 Tax=Kolteria novifilia TaxID=2527975 RepID=A0A518BBB2_9BACT|nr:Planctomycete cytochrome C [Planctomycetes bacterium Pan216]